MAFEVKDTESKKSEATKLYELISDANYGDEFTYPQLDKVLGRNFRSARNPWYSAVRRLEEAKKRTVEPVKNVGYRIVAANEHEKLAKLHHKKSARQISKSLNKTKSADRSELQPAELKRIDDFEMTLRRTQDFMKHLDARVKRQEQAIADVREQGARTHGKVQDLAENALTKEDVQRMIEEAFAPKT